MYLIEKLQKREIKTLKELLDEYAKYQKYTGRVFNKSENKRQVTETAFVSSGEDNNNSKRPNKKTKSSPGARARKFTCWNCNGEHLRKYCPKPPNKKLIAINRKKSEISKKNGGRGSSDIVVSFDDAADVVNSVMVAGNTINSDLSRYPDDFFFVLLDSQASAHLFSSKHILHNIKMLSFPITFNGISGGLTPKFQGTFLEFDNVYIDEKCPANLLSLYRVAQDHEVEWDIDIGFTVYLHNGMKIIFRPEPSGHYVAKITRESVINCVMASNSKDKNNTGSSSPRSDKVLWCNDVNSAWVTVGEMEALYRPHQVKRAREVKDLIRKLSYPSTQSLCKLLSSGGIVNCDLTPEDVYRAIKIYGQDIASLKGKSVGIAPPKIPPIVISNVAQSQLTLYVDIMFIDNDPYFISVSKPLNLTLVTHMSGSKSSSAMKRCFDSQYTLYLQRNFKVVQMVIDGDGDKGLLNEFIQSTVSDDRHVNVECVIGQHVAVIESRIRRIKERIRSHVSVLPIRLTKRSMVWLVIFVVYRYNCMPIGEDGDSISPRHRFTGIRPNYKRDLKLGFADYVQALVPVNNAINRNGMNQRTEGAIALYPTGNTGAWRFLLLNNGALVTRYHWTQLPMSVEVIERFEQLTQVSYSSDYHTRIGMELEDNNNKESFESNGSNEGDFVVDQTVEEDAMGPIQTIPEVIDIPAVEPNIAMDVQVEVDPVLRQATRSGRRVIKPARYLDPEFETHFDNQLFDNNAHNDNVELMDGGDTTEREVVQSDDENINRLVDDIVERQEAINEEVNESLQIMLAFASHRENAFNMSIKKAVEKWSGKAVSAIQDELNQMIDKEVWTAVRKSSIPRNKKIIPSFMFLKEKYLANGELERIKARLVAGGHIQDLTPYSDTSSPTVDLTSVFVVYTIAANEKRKVVTVDVKGAYLNADIKEKVYMRISREMVDILRDMNNANELYKDFIEADGCLYVQLDKALYGCVESAQLWFLELKSFLESQGFIANPADPCLYNKLNSDGTQTTVATYVDDLTITCVNEENIEVILNSLKEKYKEITVNRGNEHYYLGMLFTLDFESRRVFISMSKYVDELLRENEVDRTSLYPSPDNLLDLGDDKSDELLPTQSSSPRSSKAWFHTNVAKLLYLCKRVRPDIAFTVIYLATCVQAPTFGHANVLIKLLQYLNGTKTIGITLGAENPYRLTLFATHPDGGSHGGLLISLGFGPIYTQSKKLKLVCKSSCEAEVVALCDGVNVLMWVRALLDGQGIHQAQSIICEDNTCSIQLLQRESAGSMRTRFLRARYGFTRQFITDGSVKIKYVTSNKQAADLLTKSRILGNYEDIRTWVLNGRLAIDN